MKLACKCLCDRPEVFMTLNVDEWKRQEIRRDAREAAYEDHYEMGARFHTRPQLRKD